MRIGTQVLITQPPFGEWYKLEIDTHIQNNITGIFEIILFSIRRATCMLYEATGLIYYGAFSFNCFKIVQRSLIKSENIKISRVLISFIRSPKVIGPLGCSSYQPICKSGAVHMVVNVVCGCLWVAVPGCSGARV